MFHTIITTAYVIPNIYLFLRIGQVFINKRYRIHYVIIYLLLVSVYPITNIYSHRETSELVSKLVVTGDYILPFYLYLFLSVLVFDIFLLINLIFKIIPSSRIKSTGFKIAALSGIIFVAVAIVTTGIINFNTIRTTGYTIEVPKRKSKIDNIKITFVADFHLRETTNIHFIERFVKKINIIQPDLMLYGGDLLEGHREDRNMKVFEDLFKQIHPKYGTFMVLGNHEYYAGQDRGSFFSRAGIEVLCDTFTVIDSSINLVGRNDNHSGYRKSVDELMKYINNSLPVIMMDHRPTDLDNVSMNKVDVQFSGHTHAGQMFPINLITGKVYELDWGYMKKGNTHFFVTSGIRLWGPPVRTVGKAEIMVVNIKFI